MCIHRHIIFHTTHFNNKETVEGEAIKVSKDGILGVSSGSSTEATNPRENLAVMAHPLPSHDGPCILDAVWWAFLSWMPIWDKLSLNLFAPFAASLV